MPLVDPQDMLHHAHRHGYAVGGFEPLGLDGIEAILGAAENTRSPVVLSISESSPLYDFELAMATAETAARRAGVPVAIALARGATVDGALRAIRLGCNAVSLDVSHESFPENVSRTHAVVDMAHACGIPVEGTLRCFAADAEATRAGATALSVEEAKAYVTRTNADLLALSMGAGAVRTRGEGRTDFQRLRRLIQSVGAPVTLRDGGNFSEEQIRRLIAAGVAKIHRDDSIAPIADRALWASIGPGSRSGYTESVRSIQDCIGAEIERCMRLWGSAGRAAEVLVQCRAWQPVEQVMAYNVGHATDAQVEAMMERAREVLSMIPGVRRVTTGWAVADNPRYRFCCLIEFTHRAVIDSYREHPLHRQFADNLLRPLAVDGVSVDFEHVDSAPMQPAGKIRKSAAFGRTSAGAA